MRAKGICYDVGFLPGSDNSRRRFEADDVARDMDAIAERLHCDAVRIFGGDPERLAIAADRAARVGLEIWYAPLPVDSSTSDMRALFTRSARHAQSLRDAGAEVVFVPGCEISIFNPGFIPGDGYRDRLRAMASGNAEFWGHWKVTVPRFNEFLAEIASAVRTEFDGKLCYASGPWEFVDWGPFDVVGVDAYRDAANADEFADRVHDLTESGKPVAITEFGTCAYRGAGDRGGMAWVVPDDAVADEDEQVRYFTELMDIFESAGVDTALWQGFAQYNKVGEPADLSSYGLVRMRDEREWDPKRLFGVMADRFAG